MQPSAPIVRPIRAVLFDFDGTLTRPGALDFQEIRRAVGCPADQYILEYIRSLPRQQMRDAALQILQDYERRAAEASEPNAGAEELIGELNAMGTLAGIFTRNSLESVRIALENFKGIDADAFSVIISRDEPIPPKPSPDGIHLAARRWGVECGQILMVGDFELDIRAGKAAGARTALLNPRVGSEPSDLPCDWQVATLAEIGTIVRNSVPLKAGKLPADLLSRVLSDFSDLDSSVRLSPHIGEDCAVVETGDADLLVLTSDPITFASEQAGYYSVIVNANDIATSGATPRWMVTTLLFPTGTPGGDVVEAMRSLHRFCSDAGINLCGGHTEITDAVTRPVFCGTLVGTVARNHWVDKRSMRPGDVVLFTKGVAVEGTAIIAREFGPMLSRLGLPADVISTARRYLSQISILPEARLAAVHPGVHAMHDVTEGGVATALQELSSAGGHRLRVQMQAIKILPETERICRLLNLDPLGLIGSGSLLICCSPESVDELVETIAGTGIEVSRVGEVQQAGTGVEAVNGGEPVAWPDFEVDEITRLYGKAEGPSHPVPAGRPRRVPEIEP